MLESWTKIIPEYQHIMEYVDQEINKYIAQAVTTAKKVITEHKEQVEKIVATLLEKETIEKEEFENLVK